MALTPTLWLGTVPSDADIEYDARADRQLLEALVWSQGIVRPGDYAVTPRSEGANFSADVAGGLAFIQGDTATRQGKYLQENNGKINVPIPAPPGSGTRVHVVYLQVNDKQAGGGATVYDPKLDVAQDTGSGAPTVPSVGYPRAIPLAKVSVTHGQSSVLAAHITDLRPTATIMGNGVTQQLRTMVGTTDKSGYIDLPHTLGRKPKGCTATIADPAPNTGAQATHVSYSLAASTTSAVRARVWQMNPYFVWPSKQVTISYNVW